jgi:Tol biopolymer transport system component
MGIFTVVADESTPEETRQELFSIPASAGLLGHPVWSPDGRSVAFIYDNEVTEICLRTLWPLHTPEPRCFGSAADRQGLVWSPDAAFVAYTAFNEDEGGWTELMDVTNGHTSVLFEQRGYQLLGFAWEK